jgi:hypothetical protein
MAFSFQLHIKTNSPLPDLAAGFSMMAVLFFKRS